MGGISVESVPGVGSRQIFPPDLNRHFLQFVIRDRHDFAIMCWTRTLLKAAQDLRILLFLVCKGVRILDHLYVLADFAFVYLHVFFTHAEILFVSLHSF
jgi:hypothetical protein